MKNKNGNISSPIEFENIKLFSFYEGYYNKNVALVSKKGKWGLYSLPEVKLLTNIVYSDIKADKINGNILLLKHKNKVGLYEFDKDITNEKFTMLDAEYDSYLTRSKIYSNDSRYKTFNLYYFTKKKKICPVGINGVKFYED